MRSALVISATDNVATALEPLEAGHAIAVGERALTIGEPIAPGHKVALVDIGSGQPVIKYGSPIGTATAAIPAGRHVHTHNVASSRGRGDLRGVVAVAPVSADSDPARPLPGEPA